MPHDFVKNDATIATRLISKLRVIVGLLGELEASEALVIFVSRSGDGQFTSKIACEFKVPFETSTLMIRDRVTEPGTYLASAFFAGQRVTFEVDVLNELGTCSLPTEIKITDLRQNKRRRFGPEIEYAEISTSNRVLMATPIDMSQNSIALIINSKDGSLEKNELVRLVIRGDTTGRDVFSAQMVVQDFKTSSGQSRILLASVDERRGNQGYSNPRGVKRQELTGVGLVLSPLDDHLGEPIRFSIVDISMTGFSGSSERSKSASWLAPGTSTSVKDSQLTATVIWCDGPRVGFRLDCLDESRALGEWARILGSFSKTTGYHHSQVVELVNLFTESGLLKGSRRNVFGTNPGGFLPPDRMIENPLLFRRISLKADNERTEGHLSLVRMADDLWYAQEGAYVGSNKSGYRELVRATITVSRDIFKSSRQAPRYFAGMYSGHLSSASTEAYGRDFFSDPACRVYSMLQASIKKQISSQLETAGTTATVVNTFDVNPDIRQQAFGRFDATLVEAFGGWNGNHPRFNAELAKFGPHHEAKTVFLSNEKSGIWGMGYRLKSYYALSVSGVMNGIFLIVLPTVTAQEVGSGLRALSASGFSFGTDDAAVIVDARPEDPIAFASELVGTKPFTFFIIDNHLQREYLGGPVETPESMALRIDSKKSGGTD